jgi:hypothetical protein
MDYIEQLKTAIRDLHGCESMHEGSIAINETFQGKAVWQGVVEVFSLINHPAAKRAYAWSYKNDAGKMSHVAVLEVPPIASSRDAVRAYIVAESRKK